jgi:hypothetical protein
MLRRIMAVGLLMGLAVLGAAPAGDDSAGRPEQQGDGRPTTYYYSILPLECQIQNKQFESLEWYCTADAFYFSSYYNETITIYVPVHLPHNAVVKSFAVYVTDNGSGVDHTMSCTLARRKLSDGTLGTMAYNGTSTLASSPNRRYLVDTSIDLATISNYTYGYYIYIRFEQGSPNLKFHSAKISYTL